MCLTGFTLVMMVGHGSFARTACAVEPSIRRLKLPRPRLPTTSNDAVFAAPSNASAGQKLTFEYILIKDKTCTPQAARELKRIASHRHCKINLIPLNKGNPDMQAPDETEIAEFERILAQGDFTVLRRRPRGPDIYAACGQLATAQKKVA